jgi:PAS domain S-box-containing protein
MHTVEGHDEALRDLEERWRAITDNPFLYVAILDRNYVFEYVNQITAPLTPSDLVGRVNAFELVASEFHAEMRAAFEKALSAGICTLYETYSDVTKRWLSNAVGPLMRDGEAVGLLLLSHEITESKRTEEENRRIEAQLRHAQKLDTLGKLAGGIAHDFNNLLVPILGNAELALHLLPPDSVVRERLQDIASAAARARDLVRRILVFGRAVGAEPRESVAVAAVVREVLQFLEVSTVPNVRVVEKIVDQNARVQGVPGQLHQAVTNLCTNAVQALKRGGGTIEVGVETLRVDEIFAAKHGMRMGSVVRIRVQDDGPGMTAETLERAFEPFFTTKAIGEGTGLGLSTVHAIVTRHGGTVIAHSHVGQGATFDIYLPAEKPSSPPPERMSKPEPTPIDRPARHILCVDDEPSVLRVLTMAFEQAGYRVTPTNSSIDALEKLRINPQGFDVLVTDQTMPELTGLDLATRVYKLRRDLPVVLISGYAELSGPRRPPSVRCHVQKPALIEELVAAVERALASETQS